MERAASPNAINLLEKLDVESASVHGQWSLVDNALTVEPQNSARLMFAQKPPAAYNLDVAFTRTAGQHSVAIFIPTAQGQCSLDLDAWGQHLAGFQALDGRRLNQRQNQPNQDGDAGEQGPAIANLTLQNGTRYAVHIQVRPNFLKVFVNGKPFIHQPITADTQLTMLDLWQLPNKNAIGIGAYNARAIFHEVTLTPVNLAGAKTAGQDAGQDATKDAPAATKPTAPAQPTTPAQPEAQPAKPATPNAADPQAALSDDFDNPATLAQWQRIYRAENSPANQVARVDINNTRNGWLTVVPHASSWFKDYRGILFFKPVTGDVVVTMHVHATNRRGDGPPASQYSLMGIMMRAPRTETPVTPQTWRPGNENYIFLSAGSANQPGVYQYEVKNTVNSDSRLAISPAPSGIVTLRAVRLGASLVLLRKTPGQGWVIHQRYSRPDFPKTLQVGLTTYTDWASVTRLRPADHNTRVIQGGNPDLRAQVDYIHFSTPPALPAALSNANFNNASQISDAQIIEWLKALE